ncbi:MAG: hypothetical protein GX370_10160 [Clostridia bacterium]|jgi:predicted RNA-binding Zn-ribbon protein involved in translation (DUF1610 family)|nr:hypothetical protein [Clostridia bacterium]
MDTIKTKVAYVRGMMDGLAIDLDTKEGKVLSAMLNLLEDIADKIEEIDFRQEELETYIDDDIYDQNSEASFEEDDFIEFLCHRCGETIYVDKSIVNNNEQIECPNCTCNLISDTTPNLND